MAETTPQPEQAPAGKAVKKPGNRLLANRLFQLLCLCATLLAIVILAILLGSIFTQGIGSFDLEFLLAKNSSDPDQAGVSIALIGTIAICIICAASAIPLGVGTAILIEEFKPKHPALVRVHGVIETNIRNLAGVPSIVYGLLGIGALVFMFNLFGPINSGQYAIGQDWFDQYVDATGQQLYAKVKDPGQPTTPLYSDPPSGARVAEVWRKVEGEDGKTKLQKVIPEPFPAELIIEEGGWGAKSAAPQLAEESGVGFSQVQVGDVLRFDIYQDETLGREIYSSFTITGVSGDTLELFGSPVVRLLDAKDGSGKPAEYKIVSRSELQPIQSEVNAQLRAFGRAIRDGMRDYREREEVEHEGEMSETIFRVRYPEGEAKDAAVKAIVDQALAAYPFGEERAESLRETLTDQLLSLEGEPTAVVRRERNRFIEVAAQVERRERMGGLIVGGQDPSRVDDRAWYYFSLPLGRGVLTGGLTLMLVILPIVIVASQEALRAVPGSYRQGALALGATKWQSVSQTALPAAIPGIATGVILAISRAIGEAAPILVIGAAGYVSRAPGNLMDTFSAMPVAIFQWTREPGEGFRNIAAAGIIALLIVLLSFNALAIYIRQRASRHQA